MSQQRMIVALCLFGAVAMVAGQNFNPADCSRNVRAEADRYRESLVAAAQKFTSSLQNSAGQAIDTSAFRKDLDKLTSNAQQIVDVSQGFDIGRFTSIYLDSLSSVASLLRSSLRLSLVSGTLSDNIAFGNAIYTAQTNLLQGVTQGCLPQTRVQPVAPVVASASRAN